ncbi:MAG: hypothetical protein ABUT20_64945, partial [Bacteroidota bacterium]
MKDALKDILQNDIITKTKSGIQDLISGVKNLFRHSEDATGKDPVSKNNLNNHLKSPDEIEAEFRLLAGSQTDEDRILEDQQPEKHISILKTKEIHFQVD